MTSVYSKDLQIFNAAQFKDSVSEKDAANLYFTFGRVSPWANEANPDQANTSPQTVYEVWKNMIGAKRIVGNDIRHCIPRFNWTANTVYSAYDDTIDSLEFKSGNNPFYVMTSDWNVYKCLSNNYGEVSTVMPTSTTTIANFETTDGYIWKYMYTINSEERLKFITSDYIPVKTLVYNDGSPQWQVQEYSVDGAIDTILVTNPGSQYTTDNVSVVITGDGKEANAFIVRSNVTNTITNIIVDNRGYGYTYAAVDLVVANNVVFTGNTATARPIIGPPGGHGSDPLYELGGCNLLLDLRLIGSESDAFITNNDYRQIAIIDNPYYYATTIPASNTIFSQLTVVTLSGTSVQYLEDEYVYQGTSLANATFKGIVAQWDSPNNIIKLSNVQGTATSDLLIGDTSTASRFLDSVGNPDLNPYSGKILYINNILPIERSADQTESFRIVLKF